MATMLTVLCASGMDETSATARTAGRVLSRADGELVLGFATVSEAIAAAIELRTAMPPAAIGLSVGEVDGPNETRTLGDAASRAALAQPGEILAGEVLRLLYQDDLAVQFCALQDRPGTYRIEAIEPVPAPKLRLGLPRQLAHDSPDPFVDRPAAWAALDRAWQGAAAGKRQALFIGAEAGAGKTRLLSEFARPLVERGAVVLYGGSSGNVEMAFQPFVEALPPLLDALSPAELAELLPGPARQDLARLLHGVSLQEDAGPLSGVQEADRHWSFEAVVDLLSGIACRQPVLLLLDDLHWAARPTVRLVEHVLRSGRLERLLVVMAYRDAPMEQTDAFAEALGELCRRPGVERIRLDCFDEHAIRSFVAAASGAPEVPPALEPVVTHLVRNTAGNAFLVTESWRHLLETARVQHGPIGWTAAALQHLDVPVSIREMTNARLVRLPASCGLLVKLGACSGLSFELATVAAAANQSIEVALELASRAVAAGLLVPVAPGRFGFVHALVRQAIEDGLSASERPQHHLALARTLARASRPDDALLAHHFAAAIPLEPPATAVRHARAAAYRSMKSVSFDDAISVLGNALAVVTDDVERADLLIDLASAHALSGASLQAAKCCLEAAALARAQGAGGRVIRAAQAMVEATWRGALFGDPSVRLLQESLQLGPDPATRGALLGALSAALALSGRVEEGDAAGRAALELATDLRDDSLLLDVIHHLEFASMTPDRVHEQLALSVRGVDIARRAGDPYAELRLSCKALLRLFVVSDPPRLRIEMARHTRLAERLRQPYYLLVQAGNEVTVALAEGHFEAAEQAVQRYQDWAEVNNHAESGYGIQMFSIRREQGRLGELRPALELSARLRPGAAWAPGLAAVYAEAELLSESAAMLDVLAADGLASLPRDSLLTGVLSYLADAAWFTGHATIAEPVLTLLAPYSGLLVYVPGLACYGAADRYLGRLHETLGHPRDARRCYEAALALDQHTGWATWIAHSRFALGGHLARQGRPSDGPRGTELLRLAAGTAQTNGMTSLAARCHHALDSSHRPAAGPARTGLTPRELDVLRLLALGQTNREIGEALHASQHTIANHVRAILVKSACANRTQAAAWALGRGLADC